MKVSGQKKDDLKPYLNPKKMSPQSSNNNLSQVYSHSLTSQLNILSPFTNKEREEYNQQKVESVKEHTRSGKHNNSVNVVKN